MTKKVILITEKEERRLKKIESPISEKMKKKNGKWT